MSFKLINQIKYLLNININYKTTHIFQLVLVL